MAMAWRMSVLPGWLPGGVGRRGDDRGLAARGGGEAGERRGELGALEHERVEIGVAGGDRRAVRIHLFADGLAARFERGDAIGERGGGLHLAPRPGWIAASMREQCAPRAARPSGVSGK